ncbi:SpaA isopeptide-forming pilin-related protein [Streptomyces sp. NPDC050619]|uniref:MSCRAMM family protein n=1 Tax=Streptomyces sp. NPDC050619 TaxID=3157214 RepID=UPI00343A6AB0
MHARFVRSVAVAVAVAVAVTGTLTWAPAASAQPSEPTPSASAAPAETPAPDAGSVEITTKDTAGDALPGAAFLLLDSAGQEAGRGKADAQGKLTFPDLAPGVYRLKETASGSPIHEVVADQDVIVTPGTDTPLTIINPFKPASVLLKAKDDKTGKLLAGSTVNIGSGAKTILTLTTGSDGTASGKLPLNSRTGSDFWVKQVKAPPGYEIHTSVKAFKAKPGDPVPVTVTNAKTVTTPPPTEKPTAKPSNRPTPDQPGKDEDNPAPSASGTPTSDETASSTAAPAPAGSLAHTGADATPWLIGGAGVLIAAGGGALFAARRRRADNATDDGSTTS